HGRVRGLGGRENVPASGFSFGLERLDLALSASPKSPYGVIADLLMAPIESSDLAPAARLAETLRDAGVRVELDIKLRGARGNLRHADRLGIPLVGLLGERERTSGELVLRTMSNRKERPVALGDVVSA